MANNSPNIIVFLVEGETDQISLEVPLGDLFFNKYPEYEIRFCCQERYFDIKRDLTADNEGDDEEEITKDIQFEIGGDITSSNNVNPFNIERIITQRFIVPETKRSGIYPKNIAKIIQIVDLDGAFIPDDRIELSSETSIKEKPFYDGYNGKIITQDVSAIKERNKRKRENLEYLLHLPDNKIKIKSKRIPYEIYYFSSNLEHFIDNDANVIEGKRRLATEFFETYGYDSDAFCSFFFNDDDAIGHIGYEESWKFIKKESNSVRRFTNIDLLLKSLL